MKLKAALVFFSLTLAHLAYAQELDYTGIDSLEIDGERFSLRIQGQEGDRLEGVIQGDDRDKIEIDRRGNTLIIRVDNGWNIFSLGLRAPGTMDIRVPFTCSLDLETASGDIKVTDLDRGRLKMASASGALTLEDAGRGGELSTASGSIGVSGAAGSLKIDSASGTVTVTDAGPSLQAETASGSFKLENIHGKIALETASGGVKINRWTRVSGGSVSTVSGSITLTGLNENALSVEGETVSGSVQLWGRRYRGSFEAGQGVPRLEVSTVSGSISLE